MPSMEDQPLLAVEDLRVRFYTYAGVVEALDGVTFDVKRGQTVGLVGETGCGKSVTAQSIMRLVPTPGKIEGGKIFFKGANLLLKTPEEMRKIRGKRISMIFQDPMTYLDPVFTIGDQIMEVLQVHEDPRNTVEEWQRSQDRSEDLVSSKRFPPKSQGNLLGGILSNPARRIAKRAYRWKVIQMLKRVRMPEPEKVFNEYPHELSGGMRQRAIIAMMLAAQPELLIADEPTTALDVTIQAQILSLLRELKSFLGLSMILITHDLGIVAENCDVVNVMYAGRIVESGPVNRIFENPQHPYTQGLLKSAPTAETETEQLPVIPGSVPSLINPPGGCRFNPRCPYAMEVCREKRPRFLLTEEEHSVACFLHHPEE